MDNSFAQAFVKAVHLVATLDSELVEIVLLSLRVSLTAVVLAALIGFPIGAVLALYRFPGNRIITLLITAFMGMPPVVLGLIVYLLLSRSGPLGVLGLLYTPTAMIIAQTLLVLPIIIALTRQTIADMWKEYEETMRSLNIRGLKLVRTMLFEARLSLATAALAGFGRAIAEVGAVMIVGGNIRHANRVMTTAIALETSKGELALALALGLILLLLALTVNLAVNLLSAFSAARGYATS